MITYLVGDATRPVGEGPKVIAHIVNDCGRWGAGFSGALSRRWKEPERCYRKLYGQGAIYLGLLHYVLVGDDISVANLVAQHGLRSARNPHPLDLGALERCLIALGSTIETSASYDERVMASVHMPRIGCGLSGGSWEEVLPLLERALEGLDVFVYDLPEAAGRRQK